MSIKYLPPWFLKDKNINKIIDDQLQALGINSHKNKQLEQEDGYFVTLEPIEFRNHVGALNQFALAIKVDAIEGVFLIIIFSNYVMNWKEDGNYSTECITSAKFKDDNELVLVANARLDVWSFKILTKKVDKKND